MAGLDTTLVACLAVVAGLAEAWLETVPVLDTVVDVTTDVMPVACLEVVTGLMVAACFTGVEVGTGLITRS